MNLLIGSGDGAGAGGDREPVSAGAQGLLVGVAVVAQAEVGGELRGGDPGKRLIEPAVMVRPDYFREIPRPFSPQDGRWLLLPIHHIFGSEELSMLSHNIAQLAPKPYLALNPEDARRLRIENGQVIDNAAINFA